MLYKKFKKYLIKYLFNTLLYHISTRVSLNLRIVLTFIWQMYGPKYIRAAISPKYNIKVWQIRTNFTFFISFISLKIRNPIIMNDNTFLPKLSQNLLEILEDNEYYDITIEVG